MDGWEVEVVFETGTKTTAQSNDAAQKISCTAKTADEDSKESRNFFCPSRTAANTIYVKGTSQKSLLAEIVIAGKAWDKYPCDKGYYNPVDGTHATSGQDCQICNDGERNHERGKKACTACDNTANDIYFTKEFAHKEQQDCQVCLNYQVANTDKNACEECPAGEEFKQDCADFAADDPAKLKACTSIKCEQCPAGKFRKGTAAAEIPCQDCLVNEYSLAGKSECTPCEKHKHSTPASGSCDICKGKTYQDVVDKDAQDLPEDERLYKCFRDTGEACVAPKPITSVYGTYEPKWAKLGQKKTFDCTYDCKNSQSDCKLQAVFSCEKDQDGKLAFKPTYNCIRTSATEEYEDLDKETKKSNEDKSKDFKELTEQKKELNGLGDLEQAANIMDSIVEKKEKEGDEVNDKVLGNIVDGVSNIIDGDLGTNYTEKADILNRVVDSLAKVTRSTSKSNNLATSEHIAAVKVTGESSKSEADKTTKFSLSADDASLEGLQMKAGGSDKDTVLMVSAQDDGKAKDVAIVIFQRSKLFPDTTSSIPNPADMKELSVPGKVEEKDKPRVVNSLVVEVSAVEDRDKPYSLSLYMKTLANVGSRNESVKTFSDGTKKQLKNRCHSFDPTTEKWREDCETVYDENAEESGVLCLCKHNTSFAVLMSPYEIDPGFIESQTLMTTILLSLAMICLLLTLVFLLPAAPLRKQRSTKINICFSFSLLLASFLFLLQNSLVKPDNSGPIKLGSPGCIAYAAIQHYLWLVVFLWMVVEGVLMYLSLVQVFGSHISKYMLKFNLLCWGAPILFPIIGYFAFTKTVTVGDHSVVKSDFISENMCFLNPGGLPFWIFFFAPLVIALLVNVVFFVLVLNVIKDSKSVQVSEKALLLRQIKAAVGVMVLLGTGWLFGVLMVIPEPNTQITLQYIFILLNSSQGICVFLFYVVLNEQVTNHWLTTFGFKAKVGNSSSNSAATSAAATKGTNVKSNAAKPKTENVYENTAAVTEHTYDTAFPAKSEEHGNI